MNSREVASSKTNLKRCLNPQPFTNQSHQQGNAESSISLSQSSLLHPHSTEKQALLWLKKKGISQGHPETIQDNYELEKKHEAYVLAKSLSKSKCRDKSKGRLPPLALSIRRESCVAGAGE